MMPASCATESTSPFLTLPARISARVSGAMTTAPFATATRSVSDFSETSTIRALPSASKWVRLVIVSRSSAQAFGRTRRRRRTCAEQQLGRRGDVRLAHQALADQEDRGTGAMHALEIGWHVQPAFRDQQAVPGQ